MGPEMGLRWLVLLRGSSSGPSDPAPYIHWCRPTELGEGGAREESGVRFRTKDVHVIIIILPILCVFFPLTILATHGRNHSPIFLHASVPTDVTVAVIEVTVPLAAVFATKGRVPG